MFQYLNLAVLKFSFICFIIFLSSCKQKSDVEIPNVSHINSQLDLVRFDLELQNKSTDLLIKSYPAFADLYFRQIISICDSIQDPELNKNVQEFLKDTIIKNINLKVENKFGDFEKIEKELRQSLQYFKYYFPSKPEPKFYTFISEFGYGNFIFQDENKRDGIGIGLDFFLGDLVNYSKLDPKNPAFSNYLTRTFNSNYLCKKSWECWIDDLLTEPAQQQFLDYLIHRGKKQYLLRALLPEEQDSILFEFRSEQMDWCKKNEMEIWSFFMDSNLLYSTESSKFSKYINPSPNSPGMPEVAPGRTACFIGYKIVKNYMEKTKSSMVDLLSENNSQVILEKSRYKPKNL